MANESGLAYRNGAIPEAEMVRPYYKAIGNEEAIFKAAYHQGLALVLKGPTGCGKTRFVEAMAYDLGRPLITVACHNDLTTADLVGRYLLKGDETTRTIGIVMLTARGAEADRIHGLEVGADDYVSKPFSPRELAARIKAILRRVENRNEDEVLAAREIVLRRDSRVVTVVGDEVELTGKEFDLLACFLEHPGIVLSREKLLDLVWGITYPGGTRTVDVHVAQLRRKLGDPDSIRTVRGAGYKLQVA